jgi:hypothetical protein
MSRRGPVRDHNRVLEDIAGEKVLAALEAEGRTVRDVTRPDRVPHGGPAPDYAFQLDGQRVALEVVQFVGSQRLAGAATAVSTFAKLLRAGLQDVSDRRNLGLTWLALTYAPDLVPTLRRIDRDVPAALARISAVLPAFGPTMVRREVAVPDLASWIQEATVLIAPWIRPKAEVDIRPPSSTSMALAVAFGETVQREKASQVAGFERAILVIVRAWAIDLDDLTDALRGPVEPPWWRVYYVDRTRPAEVVRSET